MYNLQCDNCGHFNPLKSEYLTFCEKCNKKLSNNFKDWKIKNPEKSFEDFQNIVCISDEALTTLKKAEKKSKKKFSKKHLVSIVLGSILAAVGSYFGKSVMSDIRDYRANKEINDVEYLQSDTTKWIDFVDEDSLFVVRFPSQPKSTPQLVDSEAGKLPFMVYYYEPEFGKDKNIAYMAGYTTYPLELIDNTKISQDELDVMFNNSARGAVENVQGKLLSKLYINYKDYPGQELNIDFKDGMAIIKMQTFLVKNRMYILQVITPTKNNFNKNINYFFDSFELLE